MNRHERTRHIHRLGKRADVQAARAAKAGQGKVLRVVTTIDRDEPNRRRDLFVSNGEHTLGRGFSIDAHRRTQPFERLQCRGTVEC